MWDNLTFTDLDHIYKNYKKNLGWWAWLTGEQNATYIVAVGEFITCGLGREDDKLTEADKLAFITVLAVLRQKIRWEDSSLNYLVQNFWNRTCGYAMQEVLCDIATLSQLTPEVFNALQRNAPVNKVLGTQAVAPGELTLNFIKSVLFSHLHPRKAITPLYLQWCITLGERMRSRKDFYSSEILLESLLSVPAPHDFWMEAICVNKNPVSATRRYIDNAAELQQFSKLELEEIKKEADPLGSALIRLKLKFYPQLNVPSVRALLIEIGTFDLSLDLIKALTYGLEHNLPRLREIVESSWPLVLAKNLVVIKELSIDAGFERRFIALVKQNSMEGRVSVALDEMHDLSKECCELIIKTDLNANLCYVLKILPNRIFTAERCEKLAKKPYSWFFAFKEAVILFANQGIELMEIIDLLIDSPHPQQFSQGTTALIQAKLLNAQGVGLLKEAENSKKLNPIVTALQDLAEGGLLTNAVVDVLFKQVSKQKAPAQADTTPSLKVV